jgi:hypothetical protein
MHERKNRDLKMIPISTRKTKNVFANARSFIGPYHHHHQGSRRLINFKILSIQEL